MPFFPLPPGATFHEAVEGLDRLRFATDLATAELTPNGAHVTAFQPAGAAPVLFVSRASAFAPGRPIRGGVPVCFPWFSARAGHPDSPAHGFARITRWQIESVASTPASGATAVLRLESDDATRAIWPHDFVARLRAEISSSLRLTLEVTNSGSAPFTFEAALHTYFRVSDVRTVAVTGLAGAEYLDKTDGFRRKTLGAEPLRFAAETDWVFPANDATCVIDDPGLRRRIVVEKAGSRSTIVWNPWIAKAAAMPDFGDEEWPSMLCVETANVGQDAITLAPGARHAMSALIRVE
jgi:D-hexose-6-phosphate mutarotase